MSPRKTLGVVALGLYRVARDCYVRGFSVTVSGAFAAFGRKTTIEPPARIVGERRIAIGARVFIGANSWLQALPGASEIAIEIGDGTSIAGHCVISASEHVRLGERVLVARGVYISDHNHAYGDVTRAVLDQGITKVRSVEVGDGAWLGENVVVAPGVTIGRGSVIGANAVVLDDVPDYSVAVGVPARVIQTFGPSTN